jgi:M6 family metalloprotease-like protein
MPTPRSKTTFEKTGKPVPAGGHILDLEPWDEYRYNKTDRGVTVPFASTPISPPSGPLMSFLKGLHPKSNSLAITLGACWGLVSTAALSTAEENNKAPAAIIKYDHGVQTLDYKASKPGSEKTFRVAVLMINTLTKTVADNPKTSQLESYSPEKLGHVFFEHEHGTNAYIKEASYGKVALEGRVVGWINHPKAGLKSDDVSGNSNHYLSLANDYLKYSDYDIFVVHALVESGGQQTGWLYPQQSFNTPQGSIKNKGITWMINSQVFDSAPLLTTKWSSGEAVLPTTSWAHELLHTFGITGHSNSYDCGKSTLASDGKGNPIKAYGGVFSIMGEHAFGTHPDAIMKSRIGWISPAQMPEVTQTSTHEIYPLALNDGKTKALVIPLNDKLTREQNIPEFDALVVEYRTATGFDRYLKRLEGSPFLSTYSPLEKIDTNGVVVYMRYKSRQTDGTALLDMNPDTAFHAERGIKTSGNVGKFADAILPVGRTFTWENIQIKPLGTTDTGAMRVQINMAPDSPEK